jgi:hypothetical protein
MDDTDLAAFLDKELVEIIKRAAQQTHVLLASKEQLCKAFALRNLLRQHGFPPTADISLTYSELGPQVGISIGISIVAGCLASQILTVTQRADLEIVSSRQTGIPGYSHSIRLKGYDVDIYVDDPGDILREHVSSPPPSSATKTSPPVPRASVRAARESLQ